MSTNLTFEQAETIRYEAKGGKFARKDIAKRYGVSISSISDIVNYRSHRPAGMAAPAKGKGKGNRAKRVTKPQGPRNACACGCGEAVVSLAARWVSGHQMRQPENRVLINQSRKEPRTDAEFVAETLENTSEVYLGAETPCRLWDGCADPKTGYVLGTRPGRQTSRHRLIYEASRGLRLPKELHVDHKCAHQGGTGGKLHRRCMNPDHLQVVTQRENNRLRNGPMNEQKVRELRRLKESDPNAWTNRKLSDRYGISPSAVSHIVRGRNWQGVH